MSRGYHVVVPLVLRRVVEALMKSLATGAAGGSIGRFEMPGALLVLRETTARCVRKTVMERLVADRAPVMVLNGSVGEVAVHSDQREKLRKKQ